MEEIVSEKKTFFKEIHSAEIKNKFKTTLSATSPPRVMVAGNPPATTAVKDKAPGKYYQQK